MRKKQGIHLLLAAIDRPIQNLFKKLPGPITIEIYLLYRKSLQTKDIRRD